MDDNFKARVEKVFGSLSSSRSPWSLTDDKVEKREWRRDRASSNRDDDKIRCSSSFDGLFSKERKNSRYNRRKLEDGLEDASDNDGDDNDENEESGGADEWEIRSSIGMDSTLDNEEEEDDYDRVAEGREKAGDRLFMRDINDHGRYLNSHNVLPSSVTDAARDPRANHLAATVRLKEDEVEARKFDSNQACKKHKSNVEGPCAQATEEGGKPKPILKRKADDASTSKAQKCVRFGPGCKNDYEEEASEEPEDFYTSTPSVETTISVGPSFSARVPDYVLNPSRYTRYSFDSVSEVDDELNSQVCTDFLTRKEYRSQLEDKSSHLPKSVAFVPRNKATGTKDGSKQQMIQAGFSLGIAAGETQEDEASVVEDEKDTNAADTTTPSQKPWRHYRSKLNPDDSVS